MIEIQAEMDFFGFVGTELVKWYLTEQGHLAITTLDDRTLYLGKDRWHHKKGFLLGPGKLEFTFPHNGKIYAMAVRMTPMREQKANKADFYAGRNGPFNLSSKPLSEIFGGSLYVIDPDNALSEITANIPKI